MSQSLASATQNPNPMKKKVLSALIAVAIGHVGVLFAISQMQGPELKKIEKEPLKVRFVKITEDAPPPPPPPADPVKPKVQPKPEPKVVEPQPVVKPKIIAEKPQPKVEKAKPIVVEDDTQEKLKREQERLEQQRLNQERIEQQKREQAQREQAQREQAQREQQAREQAERERREQEARNNTPRNLSQGQISWVRSPKPAYTNQDLQGSDRTIVVSISADATGRVTDVRIVRSSGVDSLDQKVVRAVRGSKFRPYKENGVAYPFKAEQPFELKLNSNG